MGPVVGGNWKSTGNMKSVKDLLGAFKAFGPKADAVETVLFAPHVHIALAQKTLAGSTSICVGAQNFSKTGEGAFTGEVFINMCKDLGLPWVMVGHSERRS